MGLSSSGRCSSAGGGGSLDLVRFVSTVSGCFGGFLLVAGIRINLSLYSLDKIMAGNMCELISGLQAYDREQRLKSF